MIKTFPIEFVRQALEQTLLEQHLINPNFFGGKDQINISSFYQQLKNQAEVDRFVETFRDLTEQQNRTGLIGNGILLSPENPTITNLYSCVIIPMTWTCSIRCTLENRDQMLETINNLISELKGSKVDVAQLNCIDENGKHYAQPFVVGTVGHNEGAPIFKNGDYVGEVVGNLDIEDILQEYNEKEIGGEVFEEGQWFYATKQGKLVVLYCDGENYITLADDGTHTDVVFPPEHESFEKYKVSLSFESLRCDTPATLNAKEYCEISFGGSATLVNESVKLGNDLVKLCVYKYGINTSQPILFDKPTKYWLEPLEMPSGSNANTKINQLVSNNFLSNSHTDAISLSLQYTFIADMNIPLIKQWFDYARYGTRKVVANSDVQTMSPNLIYTIVEYWSSWGIVDNQPFKAKLVENIDIENTESDTLTLSINAQIQGDNN